MWLVIIFEKIMSFLLGYVIFKKRHKLMKWKFRKRSKNNEDILIITYNCTRNNSVIGSGWGQVFIYWCILLVDNIKLNGLFDIRIMSLISGHICESSLRIYVT